jgi:Lipid A 3-O-deacylase (PagL)
MTRAAVGRWASLFVLLLVSVIRPANAEPLCASCEIQLGVGGTYHFWGSTDGVVLPLTVSWDENRYEVGVFRMASQQTLSKDGTSQALADPYWGVSASRRWKLMERGPVRAYFGFGLAYREETDVLSATRWDFASQLGLRVRLPRNGSAVELTLRHWSNAGIKQPNHGQDFATLTFLVNPQFFGAARLDQGRDLPFMHGRESLAAISR